MAAWGNRYSALLQEPSSHKPSPEFSSAFSEPAHASFSPGNDSNVPTKIKYPPNSSVFVASLPAGASDSIQSKLTNLVSEYIQQFSVKIIDDKLGHKAAFVQTKSSEDAQRLLENTLALEGKLLRLELARAHRTLHLSFKNYNVTTLKLRIIRDAEGHLRATINEATAPAVWTPRRPDDQFSGTGYLITNFQLDEENLGKLCGLIGPLESFHKHTAGVNAQDIVQSHSQEGPDGVKVTENEMWEVKWGVREDAMEAKSLFTTIPFIRWSWAHTRGTDMNRQRSGYRARLGSEQFAHHQRYDRAGNRNTGWVTKHDAKIVTPDGFSSSTIDNHKPQSGFFRKVAQHQRAASDDPEAPITPVSIRHTSPQIASAAENELPPPLLDSKAEGAPQKFNHPDLQPSRDAGILYDMSTLFVAGVPKWSKDENLKGLFEPFGEIVDISFTTTRGDHRSAFISFTNSVDAAAAVRAALEGRHFILDNNSLKVHYKRITSAARNRRNNERTANQSQFAKPGLQHGGFNLKDNNIERTVNLEPRDNEQLEVSDTKPSEIVRSNEINLEDDKSRNDAKEERRRSTATENPASQIAYPSLDGFRATNVAHSSVQNATQWTEMAQATAPSQYYSYYPVTHPWHSAYQWPSPAYPPMYAMSHYGHPFWYPHGGFHGSFSPPQMPYTQVNSRPKMAATDNSQQMPNLSEFHPGRAPVTPAGSYQNADGSINYIYPTDVIEKYTAQPSRRTSTGAGDQHRRFSVGYTNQSIASENPERAYYGYATSTMGAAPNAPRYQYPPIPQGQQYPATRPAHEATTQEMNVPSVNMPYPTYPPLPPPSSEMQQGTFVFNQQGVAQKVEPAIYHPVSSGGNPQGPGGSIGLAQVAAAVMVNAEQQSPVSMRPAPPGTAIPHPSHYTNNAAALGYYYPASAFAPVPQQVYSPSFTPTENQNNTNRGTPRRRASYNAHTRPPFVNPTIQAGFREDANGRFGAVNGPQLPTEGSTN